MKNIKEIKKSKGITLISLVVTIILMIILAGISIVLLFGEQGIITRAKEQKEIQIQGEILEQFELQKTNVLDYNTLKTDLKVYLDYIQANGLGAYKVTNREYIDDLNEIVWVDGKYKYKVSQVDNNVVINAEGKVGNLKPEIKEFKVINTTTNTIEVEVKAILGKKYTFTIEDNGKVVDSYEETTEEKKTNDVETIGCTFKGVPISNNEYGYTVKVVVENKVGKTEKEILANTIELPDPNFTFEKSTSDWTNENVTVKAIVNNEEAKKYILQTSKDGKKWDNTDTQTFETNGVMYAIITDGTNITDIATAQVTNIDKLPPNEFTPEITEIKTRSLTVKATVDDAEATEEDGKSGIEEYRFSKDNGSTWTAYQAENSYKFDELEQTKEYIIKVEVKDRAGNTTVGTKSTNTDTIPAGNFTFTKSTNNWTNGNVTVTVGTSITGYTLQTCKDGVSWENTNQQTLTANGTVYARLTDGVNVTAVGTGPVTNIDKAAPTIGSASGSTATANSGTVSVSSISDTGGSGLKGIYISTSSSTPTATSVTWSGNTASSYSRGVSSNATYYIWVLDNAGNVSAAKSAKVSGIVSKVNITGYSNASVIVPNTVTPTLSYSGTPKSKSFSSSDTSVATVNSNGVVTGRHVGKATITATLTNYDGTTVSKSCTVSVSEYLTIGTTKGLSVGGDWINLQTVDTANSGSGVMSYGPEGGDHIGLWNCGYFLFQSWRSYNMYDFTNAKTLTADILYDTDSPTPVAATCIVGLVNTPSKVDINHDGTGFDIQTGFYKEFTSWHRETWNMDVSNCNGGYFLKFFLYKGTYGNNYTVGFKIYSILVSP